MGCQTPSDHNTANNGHRKHCNPFEGGIKSRSFTLQTLATHSLFFNDQNTAEYSCSIVPIVVSWEKRFFEIYNVLSLYSSIATLYMYVCI